MLNSAICNSNLFGRLEAAEYLGVKPQTLAVWATNKRYNLPYVKIGRLVKYTKVALDQFIQSRAVAGSALMNGGV